MCIDIAVVIAITVITPEVEDLQFGPNILDSIVFIIDYTLLLKKIY
jgi:hypothetical protein